MEICKLHQRQIALVGGNKNPVLHITEEVRKAAHFLQSRALSSCSQEDPKWFSQKKTSNSFQLVSIFSGEWGK